MLSAEKNEILTQVRQDTPMGNLLRRYWHPIAPARELTEGGVKPVTLLGEDLVLFRKRSGGHGLIARSCPHRNADLGFGWTDGDALRCAYHGWAFDADGRCVHQPFEEAGPAEGFRDKVGLTSYPTQLLGGLIWAYLGPQPAPLLPDYEPFGWDHGFVEIIITELPCNWFQCHENAMDPVHFEWLHSNGNAVRQNPTDPTYVPGHVGIDFLEFEYGFVNGRVIETENAPPGEYARTSNVEDGGILCVYPYLLVSGNTIEFRVPIDERRTMNVTWQYSVLPDDVIVTAQPDEAIPYWYGPLRDAQTGKILTSYTANQDFAAWTGQGAITDRTSEHLGRSDRGITLLRRRYFDAMEAVARGEDPPGTVRDPAVNKGIPLPIRSKSFYTEGMPRARFEEKLAARRRDGLLGIGGLFSVQAGRPDELQRQYDKLAGVSGGDA
jgi:5,5'-dehydrodivanillate O-demethylase